MKHYLKFWLAEEQASFLGWVFSRLDKRWEMESLPWDYSTIVNTYRKDEMSVLDMGTGGGEYLLTFNHPYHNTFVTEGYPPNYELCKETLEPLGITVRFCDDDILPYDNQQFDLVINRHESFDLREVYRVLKPNGIFITQQVGAYNNHELSQFLLGHENPINDAYTLNTNLNWANSLSFKVIQSDEYYAQLKFFDIGALVYYAKIIEWEFPGFSVNSCLQSLQELQRKLTKQGWIDTIEHRYLMVLKKV